MLGTAILWGVGTALGEVPPYALSYHAAKAGRRSAEVEALLGAPAGGQSGHGAWMVGGLGRRGGRQGRGVARGVRHVLLVLREPLLNRPAAALLPPCHLQWARWRR